MPVTIKDVAEHAGVSASTVSKSIHGDPRIPEATKARVKKSIEILGYKTNLLARNFSQQKTNHIAFIAKYEAHVAFTNPHMFEIMVGVESYLKEYDYYISYKSIVSDEEAAEYIESAIAQKSAAGVIIHGSIATKELTARLIDSDFPYIIVGKPNFQTKANWIDTNNFLSGQLCGEYLISNGYTRIGFIGGTTRDNIFKQRLYGFYQAMREAGIETRDNYIRYGEPTKEAGYHSACELLDEAVPPQVIICTNNFVALGVHKAIQERDLTIPTDIEYICFDKYPIAYTLEPQPLMIDIDVYDLGTQAASYLLKSIRTPSMQIQTHSTIPSIVGRN